VRPQFLPLLGRACMHMAGRVAWEERDRPCAQLGVLLPIHVLVETDEQRTGDTSFYTNVEGMPLDLVVVFMCQQPCSWP
jgi:hypothetical protein